MKGEKRRAQEVSTLEDSMTANPLQSAPRHVAIIMDGNGRWAEQRGRPRAEGHQAGADTVRAVVRACRSAGVRYLTLYAFSEQNWGRPKLEVSALMGLLKRYLFEERREILDRGIRLEAIGAIERLPFPVRRSLQELRRESEANQEMTLTLALSYGGREELVQATRRLAHEVAEGHLKPEEIDEAALQRALFAPDHPDPALLIRTGGELRVSNFLLWQSAYAELFFSESPWPDFSVDELHRAFEQFHQRQRRFGLTGAQIEENT